MRIDLDRIFNITRHFIKRRVVLLHFAYPERRSVLFDKIMRIGSEMELLLPPQEAFNLYSLVEATSKVPGDIAEIGCYRGGSTKLICEAKGSRRLYVFDTFEGLPEACKFEPERFHKGRYAASIEEVRELLSPYENVEIRKGVFPQGSDEIKGKRFSFVHLDIDLAKYVTKSLEFFYPRMSRGGVILFHDYGSSPGVTKAVNQFFEKRREPLIELHVHQAAIVKV